MTYAEIKRHALELGITRLEYADLPSYEPLSDGCSGGLSRLYAIGGHTISCHRACVAHDYLYDQGGTPNDRKKADKLLRRCAARSGDFTGWPGPFRRLWRYFRAWVMYAAVRLFAGGENHWAGEQKDAGNV